MGLLNPVFFLLVLVLVFSSAIADGVGDYLYETKYIDVPLSHFDFTKNTTFKLRYLVNDTYWSRHKGPILFYTGNEGDIETFAQNTGFIWEIAPEFKALIVFAEHRYYGKSMPYGAKSYSDPGHSGYLSCTEAMADFVDLIYKIWDDEKAKHPVIAIGGSYGGMLSAWIRMKYPSTFIGALASSAPIWQFEGMTPCNTFNRIMTSAYTMANPECSETVRKFWPLLEKYGSTDDGRRLLSQSWKLCGSLNSTEDVKTLKEYVSEALAAVAMVNYPYETSFLAPLPPYPVKAMCQFMNDSKLPELGLLGNVFKGISVYFNYTGSAKCLNTDLDADGGVSYSGWNYQACTEMVMPFCSDGVTDMLPAEKWDFEEVSNDCYTKRGVKPQLRQIEKLFGGKDIHEHSNIIFSNGLLDPWSGGGVLQDISPSIQTVIIPEAAHHLDLRASNPADPDSVKRARKLYKHIFKRWLADFHARPLHQGNKF